MSVSRLVHLKWTNIHLKHDHGGGGGHVNRDLKKKLRPYSLIHTCIHVMSRRDEKVSESGSRRERENINSDGRSNGPNM